MDKLVWVDAEGVGVTLKPGTGFFYTITENGPEQAPPPTYLRPDGTETTQARPERRTVPGAYHALAASIAAYRSAQGVVQRAEKLSDEELLARHSGDIFTNEGRLVRGTPEWFAKAQEHEATAAASRAALAEEARAAGGLSDEALIEKYKDAKSIFNFGPVGSCEWLAHYRGVDLKEQQKAAEEAAAEEVRRNSPLYRACAAISGWQPRDRETMLVSPPLRMLVDGLIPAGKVGTFVSAGGGGKTSLLMKLGISIATGQSWFEFDVLERGATVLLSGEDDQEDLDGALAELLKVQVEWIRSATKGTGKHKERKVEDYLEAVRQKVRLISLRGRVPAFTKRTERGSGFEIDTEVRDELVEALAEIDDLRLVIPDTLRRFAQAPSIDEEAMAKAISVAEYFAEAIPSKPTVIVPHHTTKDSFRKGITDQYAAFGSGVTVDNTRFGINFREVTGKELEEMFAAAPRAPTGTIILADPSRGSLRMKKAEPFLIQRDGWAFSRVRAERKTQEQLTREADRAVLERIAELERAGTATITGALVFATVPCKNGKEGARLKALAIRGLVLNRNAGGKAGLGADWRLTEAGQALLAPKPRKF
jgi:hypothetical protein